MAKKLIVNADDYGRTVGVARGILRAHRAGIVTSTTAMVNMPDIAASLRLARGEPALGLGVHLVFTAGAPVLPAEQVPCLVDPGGSFWSAGVWQTRLDKLDPDELWAEWQAQLAVFRAEAGEPDHLDCHHFLHLYPPIFALYLRLADTEGLPARVPFASEAADDSESTAFGANFGVTPEVVSFILQADRTILHDRPVPHPDHFFVGFVGDQDLSVTRLFGVIDAVPDGVSEIMVHPVWTTTRCVLRAVITGSERESWRP